MSDPNEQKPEDEAQDQSLDEQVADSEPMMEEFAKGAKTEDAETLDEALKRDD